MSACKSRFRASISNNSESSFLLVSSYSDFGIPKVISLLEFSENCIWFVPSAIEKRLKGVDKSAKLSYFLETMKPYLIAGQDPYKKKAKFYRLNLNVITSSRTAFIKSLAKIKEIIER